MKQAPNNAASGVTHEGFSGLIGDMASLLLAQAHDGMRLLNALATDITSEDQIEERIAVVDELYEAMSEHPEAVEMCEGFAQMILSKIEAFEDSIEMPQVPPAELLALLMKQHKVRQKDLSSVAGQSTISAILNGRREPTKEQAIALAEFFDLPKSTFL